MKFESFLFAIVSALAGVVEGRAQRCAIIPRRKRRWKPANERCLFVNLLISGLASVPLVVAHGQIFVVNDSTGTIGEYTTSGATMNASLVSGLSYPNALTTDGSGHLFVANSGTIAVGEYTTSGTVVNASLPFYGQGIACDTNGHIFALAANGIVGEYTTSGATVNASLITGLNTSQGGIALDGKGDIFVQHEPYPQNTLTVGEWTTNGVAVNPQLFTGNGSSSIAYDGNGHLFVTTAALNGIAEYTTSGSLVNASLVSGLTNAECIALDGNGHLFVTWGYGYTFGYIGEFTTSGTTINARLISGLHGPLGLVVLPEAIPSPSIAFGGGSSLVVSWPNTGSYTLQTNSDLSSSAWGTYSGTVNTANGTNDVTITPSGGNLFFRLSNP